MKQVVLLGAGHAHLLMLRALAQRPLDGVRLTLVSAQAQPLYSGMVPGVVAGHYREAQARVALPPLAQAAGAAWRAATAVALDARERVLMLSDGSTLGYDLLSIATGAVQDREAIPGAREYALFLKPLEAFLPLVARLRQAAQQDSRHLAVVGAGAAGFEMVLALAHAINAAGAPHSRFALVTGGGEVLPGYPPSVVRRALAVLQRAGVTVLRGACTGIANDHFQLDGCTRVPCDLALMATGVVAPPWLRDSGLALDAAGFVATGPTLQSGSHPQVLAAGDVASRIDAPQPRSGVQAVRSAATLAYNLRALIDGRPLRHHRPPVRTLNLLSCGRREAIAAWGAWSAHGAWAWHWKDAIDRRFLRRLTG